MSLLGRFLSKANEVIPEVLSPTIVDHGYRDGQRVLEQGQSASGRLTGVARHPEQGGERYLIAVEVRGESAVIGRAGVRLGRSSQCAALRLGMGLALRVDGKDVVLDFPAMAAGWGSRLDADSAAAQAPIGPPQDGINDRVLDARVVSALKRWTPARARIVAVRRRSLMGMATLNFDVDLELEGGARSADHAHEIPFYAAWLAAPGAVVPVVVDPDDPGRAVVDWPAAALEGAARPGAAASLPADGGAAAALLAPPERVPMADAGAPAPDAPPPEAGSLGPADVPLELWAKVTISLQTARVAPAGYDEYAETHGVPAGRWTAADAEWQRLMTADWRIGAQMGEALGAARRARKRR